MTLNDDKLLSEFNAAHFMQQRCKKLRQYRSFARRAFRLHKQSSFVKSMMARLHQELVVWQAIYSCMPYDEKFGRALMLFHAEYERMLLKGTEV